MDTKHAAQTAAILEKFSSADPDELRSAAFDAGACKLAEAVPHLIQLIQSNNLGVQEAAEDALRSIRGPETVRDVAPLLRSDDAPVRNSAMDILREIGEDDIKVLGALMHDDDSDVRIFVSDILGTCREHAAAAVTLLADALLSDPEVNVRYQAAISLGELGNPAAASALRKAMNDEEWVKFAVVEALTKIRADSCLGILLQALPRSSGLMASTIIDALGEMKNLKAVPLLLQQLDRAGGPLRNKAVKAIVQILGVRSLGLLGAKEQEKFQAYLLAALGDEDEDVTQAALLGLSGMGSPVTTQAVLGYGAKLDPTKDHDQLLTVVRSLVNMGFNRSLADALLSPDEQMVRLAVEVCRNMPNDAAVDVLSENFWNFNRDTQRLAVEYLARECGERHIPFFEDILYQYRVDAQVITRALNFLGEKVRCIRCGPKMFTFLRNENDEVKEAALEACIALGDASMNETLAAMYKEDNPLMRMMAVYAMGRIGDPVHVPELEEALGDEVPDVRKVALEALAQDPERLLERLPFLSSRLDDENCEVRRALVDVLDKCPAEQATELLLRALNDQDDWVRIRAIGALGQRRLAAAVPHLVEMLEHSHIMVTLKIIEALGAIGDNVSFQTLLGQMEHEDPEVQHAAATAIARIREEQGGDL
jgi:HEAT repeat protein